MVALDPLLAGMQNSAACFKMRAFQTKQKISSILLYAGFFVLAFR